MNEETQSGEVSMQLDITIVVSRREGLEGVFVGGFYSQNEGHSASLS